MQVLLRKSFAYGIRNTRHKPCGRRGCTTDTDAVATLKPLGLQLTLLLDVVAMLIMLTAHIEKHTAIARLLATHENNHVEACDELAESLLSI